jgi:hypothetical protein
VFQLGVLDAEFNSLSNDVTLAEGHRTERRSATEISIFGPNSASNIDKRVTMRIF